MHLGQESEEVFPLDFWPWSYRAEPAVHSLAEGLAGFVSIPHLEVPWGERVVAARSSGMGNAWPK